MHGTSLLQTGTTQLRRATVVEHGNSSVHAVALALWQSGGAFTTVGGLPLPVRAAIFGMFQLVYQLVKRFWVIYQSSG